MNLDALVAFVAVADAGGFAAGAARVGRPRSTVSRQIAQLELELGGALFFRTTRRVALSPAGARLLERVGPHIRALQHVARGDAAVEPEGVLRLTSTPDVAAAVLAEAVARYLERYPGLRVEVLTGLDLVDLVAEGVDLALRASTGAVTAPAELAATRLGSARMRLYAAPRYLARAGTPASLGDLAGHTVLGIGEAGDTLTMPWATSLASNDMAFLRTCAVAGAGVAVLTDMVASEAVAHGELVALFPEWSAWEGSVWLVSPHGRQAPARVVAFREVLGEVLERSGVLPR